MNRRVQSGLFESSNAASPPPVAWAQVVVERGIDRFPNGLTYGLAADLADVAPGDRVIVPLGRGDRETAGYVIEVHAHGTTSSDPARLKNVVRRDAAAHHLPADLIELAHWISRYYCTPIGVVLAAMLPAAVKRDVGRVTRTVIDVVPARSPGDCDDESSARLSPQQRAVLSTLHSLRPEERPIEIRDVMRRAGVKTRRPVQKLIDRGLLLQSTRTRIEAEWVPAAIDHFIPDRLTEAQSRTFNAIAGSLSAGFSTHLLFGVTGSGKTEVYIRLIDQVLRQRKVALMLVPEISLTPQTGGRLIGRFPDHRVAVLHSGLRASQRNQNWSMVASGDADLIIGARSAVFAPIPPDVLGLILVDEEHDGSYKQDQAPRYHGRDVAIRRAQIAGCPIVLGSATPSLESWLNARGTPVSADAGKKSSYILHRLNHRVPGTSLPSVTIVDFRDQMRQRKDREHVHLVGPLLEAEMRLTLDAGHQAMLLLNRRGYANYVACPSQLCGWTMQCDHCDSTMVYHRNRDLPTGGFLRCHHCLSEQKSPTVCPMCGKRVVTFGLGTQRVEDELQRMFSDLIDGESLFRIDSDTMSNAVQFHETLGRFARGEIRVLVGTQMIAKGLDFPKVRLVGVINADTALNLPDFRAAERTFQLVSQVAGRCGRGQTAGRVVVQSFNPSAMPIQKAADHDYDGFAKAELAVRSDLGLPPTTRMARLVVRHQDYAECVTIATRIAARLRELADDRYRLRGPAPCPISRIGGFHRQQIEVLAANASDIQALLTAARNEGLVKSDGVTAVDVDPIALL